MKKKSVFLSKVFAVALAASMAFSTPYASAEVVTSTTAYEGGKVVTTQSTAWWSAFSDYYRQSGDFDVTFEISNKSDTATNWDNVAIILSSAIDYVEGAPNDVSGYSEYMVMRVDNWCWSPVSTNITNEGVDVEKVCDWNFDTFSTIMSDAKITLNVTRTGDDFAFVMKVVGSDGNTYNQSYKFNTKADKDVNIFFTGEKADVAILSYTVNGAATDAPATDAPATDVVTDSAIDTTPVVPEDTTPVVPEDTTPVVPEDTTPAEPEDTTTEEPAEDEEVAEPAKLNKKKATVKVGKSVKLKVKNADGKVKWSSSNKKVAKVNKSGKVTGVKAGKAVIKAKVNGETLKCKVTVK